MKNKALFGVIGLVVVACMGLVGYAAWRILKRQHGSTGVAGRISRDAAVVFSLDLRPLRSWQPATNLHDTLLHPPEGAEGPQREIAQRYQELITRCGFEPWQKIDGVTAGIERSMVEGRDQSALAVFVDGTYTQAEADRCLRYLASQDHRTLVASQVGRHTVQSVVREGEQPTPSSSQLTQLPGTTLFTEGRYTQRALAVYDGTAPALAADAPLSQMVTRLGAGVFLASAADLALLRSRQERTIDEMINDAVRDNPAAPDLALLRQARIGGAAFSLNANAVTATVRVELPTSANAQALARAVQSVIVARRPALLEAMHNARSAQAATRLMLGMVAGMQQRFQRIDAALDTAESLVNQLACRAEGSDAVASVTATAQQVTTIQEGIKAFTEIMAEASRANPLGNIFGGGGGGRNRGMPELDMQGVPGGVPQLQPPSL